jgi:hypothetical protein
MGTVRLTDLSWELPSVRADVDVPLLELFGAFGPGEPEPTADAGLGEPDGDFDT